MVALLLMLSAPAKPTLVMVIAEDEYNTAATLPVFAKSHLADFEVKTVEAEGKHGLKNLETVKTADVLLLSVRRRPLLKDQMAVIRGYVEAKKPIVALRTSSHAFAVRKGETVPEGVEQWPEFDEQVLGCHYANHYGHKVDTKLTRGEKHAILENVPNEFVSKSGLYKSNPLAKDCIPLLWGTSGDNPKEPVAWCREANGKLVYIALAHTSDFENAAFTTLLTNACRWAVR